MKRTFMFILPAIVVVLSLCPTASAQSQTVYVTNGPAGQVLIVSVAADNSTTVQEILTLDKFVPQRLAGGKSIVPRDITVGPDNKVYICAPDNNLIVRFDPARLPRQIEVVYPPDRNAPALAPESPRFNAFGDLLVNSPSGVYKFAGVALPTFTPPAAAAISQVQFTETGEGLAFTNRGDLLIVDQNYGNGNIWSARFTCSPVPPANCSYSRNNDAAITGLSSPFGVARDSRDKIYVAEHGTGKIQQFNSLYSATPPLTASEYASFSANSTSYLPYFLRFAADDTLYVTTADAADANGMLWKVTPPTDTSPATATLLLRLPAVKGKYPPAIGVALPGTSTMLCAGAGCAKPALIGNTGTFNFGPHGLQLAAGTASAPCSVTITSHQKPPSALSGFLPTGASVLTHSGQEGWITTYTLQKTPSCPVGPDGMYDLTLFGYFPMEMGIFPEILRCANEIGTANPNCGTIANFGYFPFGLLPDDPGTSGKTNDFSEYVLINGLTLASTDTDKFCGFQSPLIQSPVIVNGGSNVTVKFQLATKAGNCSTGPFDPSARAFLSAQFLEGGSFTPMIVTPSGSSNSEPLFRTSATGPQYIYNLNTTNPDGSRWPSGTYLLTVSADKFYPRSICVCVDRCIAACPLK